MSRIVQGSLFAQTHAEYPDRVLRFRTNALRERVAAMLTGGVPQARDTSRQPTAERVTRRPARRSSRATRRDVAA